MPHIGLPRLCQKIPTFIRLRMFGNSSTDGYSNSNEVTYGAGFEIKNFRLEYQQLNNMSSDPRIYTLGYVFRFNEIKE
jgi:hypothetical protein